MSNIAENLQVCKKYFPEFEWIKSEKYPWKEYYIGTLEAIEIEIERLEYDTKSFDVEVGVKIAGKYFIQESYMHTLLGKDSPSIEEIAIETRKLFVEQFEFSLSSVEIIKETLGDLK